MPQIIPTSKPFFFSGKPSLPGCLLIHGFTGASDKTKLYITESGHIVTRDAARGQVFEAVKEVIQRIEAAA